jgi:DNA mismatch repair protein MutS
VHLDATEHADKLIFLHTVKEGPANQSYGLQVAALAGVPQKVIIAARRYLRELERRTAATHGPRPQQELLLELPAEPTEHDVVRKLRELDPDAMTPKEALDALYALKKRL